MTKYELNYSPLEKICSALVWCTRRLRHYMLAFPIILISRIDPLKYLFQKPALTNRISRWTLMLAEFDIRYAIAKSVKGKAVTEYLSDLAIEFKEEKNFLFPNESVMEIKEDIWKMHFQGAAN